MDRIGIYYTIVIIFVLSLCMGFSIKMFSDSTLKVSDHPEIDPNNFKLKYYPDETFEIVNYPKLDYQEGRKPGYRVGDSIFSYNFVVEYLKSSKLTLYWEPNQPYWMFEGDVSVERSAQIFLNSVNSMWDLCKCSCKGN